MFISVVDINSNKEFFFCFFLVCAMKNSLLDTTKMSKFLLPHQSMQLGYRMQRGAQPIVSGICLSVSFSAPAVLPAQ